VNVFEGAILSNDCDREGQIAGGDLRDDMLLEFEGITSWISTEEYEGCDIWGH